MKPELRKAIEQVLKQDLLGAPLPLVTAVVELTKVYGPILPEGVLRHEYVDASDDIAAYMADRCKRQAVTAEFAFEKLPCDINLYVFVLESYNNGLEPWITIDGGMDKTTDGRYVLCYGRAGELIVDKGFRVFVSKRALEG